MIVDSLGNLLSIKKPERIISLVPSWTEFVADIGKEDYLIAITDYCSEPSRIQNLERVGGTKNPKLLRIKELSPDIVIVNKEENKPSDINLIRSWGLKVFVTAGSTVCQIIYEMKLICTLLDVSTEILTEFHEIEKIERNSTYTFVYLIWKEPYMVAGIDTYIHSVIEMSGGCNLIKADRYPQIKIEELIDLKPDIVFLPDEPYVFVDEDKRNLETLLPLSTIVLVDGKLASWFGFRLRNAINYFTRIGEVEI
ncbi:MAG: helical backbone metal receptor [Candidatus Kariarchaeaceae archaeon]